MQVRNKNIKSFLIIFILFYHIKQDVLKEQKIISQRCTSAVFMSESALTVAADEGIDFFVQLKFYF